MKTYYETYEYMNSGDPLTPDGIDLKGSCTATAHETLEDAIKYADAHGCVIIAEIGGSWDEYEKCDLCGDWVASSEINKDALCWRCELALYSRGEL